jgi:calcineurin-like phosphoesterase family protein
MIYFTADTHFGHANIIKYCHRPFKTADEMDETMIENWNKSVKDSDIVYLIGDMCFGREHYFKIKARLKGKIFLIEGDHDKDLRGDPTAFNLIGKVSLLNMNKHNGLPDKMCITLCHWSMRVWAKSHYNSWHLFGHSHGGLQPVGKSWDVGVDNNNFTPLSLDQIIEIMKIREDNFNCLPEFRRKSFT